MAEHPLNRNPAAGTAGTATPMAGTRNSAGVIAPGVDIRAGGGFVVAPGTRGYTWYAEQPSSLDDIPVLPGRDLPVSVNGTHAGHWNPLDRAGLDPRDLAGLEALEALGGHGAYSSGGYVAITRPGKTAGASASIGHIGPGIVRVFTPNWPPLTADTVFDVDQLRRLAGFEHDDESTVTVITLANVAAERVSWLWGGHLPAGKLVVLDGDPSVGKSTLAIDWAARFRSAHRCRTGRGAR
jgi:hypothetical protein